MVCFNAVQNNTSLKLIAVPIPATSGFNAVQNNTSLKQMVCNAEVLIGFNAVQNNTSLKHDKSESRWKVTF